VRPELCHVTLKFLGTTPEDRLEGIRSVAEQIANDFSPFVIHSEGVGAFPDPRRPRVVWIGLGGSGQPALIELAEHLDIAMEPMGFEREGRAFLPHMTLGRVKPGKKAPDLSSKLGRLTIECAEWPVDGFHLIRSDLRPSGPEYTTLRVFPLSMEDTRREDE
jgi:RNA 2',3'-cyclic 3'-phosphodiesterase